MSVRALSDGEIIAADFGGGSWHVSWHGPRAMPEGTPHGAAALCVTRQGDVVLITGDGERWDAPGGRPEAGETLEETMRREVLEEACARVTGARLLGFSRGACVAGPEAGLTLIRSAWRADVELLDWSAKFETTARRIETPARAWEILRAANPATWRFHRRWFEEAGLV